VSAEQPIPDFDARQEALDITRSIAVQAPAGSGKTELLSLRFLKLLAVCQHPEEVLAITFTKKAANEMAQRILSTLDWAQQVDPATITKQLDRDRHSIAQHVLAQDAKEGWQLQQSPSRLRIQTIDSFCNFLASRLPILSNFGGPLPISEQIEDCYQLAIRNCLALLDSEQPISAAIARLLRHLDNDGAKLESLLTSLLQQREQWIGDIVDVAGSPQQALEYLNDNLVELIEESLAQAREQLLSFETTLMPLLQFATKNLSEAGSDSRILECAGLTELPGSDHESLSQWLGLSQLLLVKTATAFRKDVRKDCGFPPQTGSKEQKALQKEMKQQMKDLLQALSESEQALQAIDYLRRLPLPDDDALSWEFLETLTAVLPTLMAQLEIAFTQMNKIDYPQVSLAALRALGSEDSPTDLALSLDYQIKHVLVDEFQDTSASQMELLRKITAGWEIDDGRTLFVVGDAMQSCYGFRNANVGLFISIRETGIGSTAMSAIDLLANFRSDAGVVDWVNTVFKDAFPAKNDISRGAVSYVASHAVHPVECDPAVSSRCYQYTEGSKLEASLEEAAFIAEEICQLRKQHPDRSIAILVRGRSHLEYILPALREAEVPWLATDIDRLDTLPLITDLLSLTSSICNQADRLSWLAILRAPWCGLSLSDLHIVANWNDNISVYASLREIVGMEAATAVSADGLARLSRLTAVLEQALASKLQNKLHRTVRLAFNALGGEQIARSSAELDSVESFYEILEGVEVAGALENFADFEARIAASFVSAPAHSENNPVEIMTIHKSKGLEFDHVFLPGLARKSPPDEKSLLLWHQRLNEAGENKLFLATLSATGSEDTSLYNLLRFEKAEKTRMENARLLYIGITRAIKSAYLSSTLEDKEGEAKPPTPSSLLATIWDSLAKNSDAAEVTTVPVDSTIPAVQQQNPLTLPPGIHRLPSHHFDTLAQPTPQPSAIEEPDNTAPDLGISNQLQVEIGNLIHESLQNFLTNRRVLEPEQLLALRRYWARHLNRFVFEASELDAALDRIEHALRQTLGSEELAWVFDNDYEVSDAELPMQSYGNGVLHTHILDRSFIDKQGVRWIVDYKSSEPQAGQSEQDFVEEQLTLYSEQLARYRRLFQDESNKGIKTALLFTSLPRLVECS